MNSQLDPQNEMHALANIVSNEGEVCEVLGHNDNPQTFRPRRARSVERNRRWIRGEFSAGGRYHDID